jgi:D-aminoacyl-tRNA deacylase
MIGLLQRVTEATVEVDSIEIARISGGLLLVPQFTLAADTRSGTRAGFSTAAEPARARELFERLVRQAQAAHPQVGSGRFGADMKVRLVNDGPVTFWLEAH